MVTWSLGVMLLSWAGVIAAWLRLRKTAKLTVERRPFFWRVMYSAPAFAGCCMILASVAGIGPFGPRRGSLFASPIAEILAVAVTVLGAFIAFSARKALGANWSAEVVIKQDHELVDWGPYRWIRHPIYLGVVLMVAGVALTAATAAALIGFALVVLAAFIKIDMEEQLLLRHFSDRYGQYRQRTKRVLPFVW